MELWVETSTLLCMLLTLFIKQKLRISYEADKETRKKTYQSSKQSRTLSLHLLPHQSVQNAAARPRILHRIPHLGDSATFLSYLGSEVYLFGSYLIELLRRFLECGRHCGYIRFQLFDLLCLVLYYFFHIVVVALQTL